MPTPIDHLNPQQREAATYLAGPLMIIAGAGSGKTRVITHRIAFLHREVGIPLNRILSVTFTNKAAKEMRERVCRILGMPDMPGLPVGTFHSRCALILRYEAEAAGLDKNFAILDESDQKQAIKRVLKEMGLPEKRARPTQVQAFINQAKMRLLTPEDVAEEFEDEIPYGEVYKNYQKLIDASKTIDFEGLLMQTVLLFQQHEDVRQHWAERYQYVMVDEYQDTNHAQFLLTKLLARDHRNVCIVGDEDQSIYSWRGADITNLLEFEKSFPGVKLVKLEQNYRSTQVILRAANQVIGHNVQRIGKNLFTEGEEGEPLTFLMARSQEEESQLIAQHCTRLIQMEGVSPNDIAIFYRGHWLSRGIEDQLRQYRLPYRIVGGVRFYDRAEIKDLLCYLRLAVNPDDDLAFERVVNRPTRGVGPKSLNDIAMQAAERGCSLFNAAAVSAEMGILKGKARTGVTRLVEAVYQWHAMVGDAKAREVLDRILFDTNYKEDGLGDTTSIESESRLQNIEEFEGLVAEFSASGEDARLTDFLTTMALDANAEKEDNSARISLLTIHNAKGLEFDYVFTIGMESGVFPTRRAEEDMEPSAIEEERRLFYVAITRARQKLFLTYAARRNRPDLLAQSPSMFLNELKPDVFDEQSRMALKRLLPYGWGGDAPARASKAVQGGREVVYDDAETFGAPPRAGGLYSRTAAGLGHRAAGSQVPRSSRSGAPQLTVGTRVLHRHMGPGQIVELGGRPGWERATIDFDDGRSQEFVLRYAPLTVIDE